ncbi:uncharacterized protein LOC116347331 [Contarinia nasturtii]|uniref:uncharacterized protein LOC116347331 n=1 Tax=Contarinia nasturtii TaxID=265458 RepID=UPI0012D4060D|nr:uncharacterized protein LOC116347331 [Contarinia nasturtii]
MSNGNCSPAMSASPVPAAPPQPPQRTCSRCRFTVVDNHTGQSSAPNYGNANNSYTGYDGRGGRYYEEEDSACPALLEREFHSIHRNVPGLRRAGVDTNAIRQHFYPDGGYGWIVSGVAFLAHVMTTGFQLSYGLLYLFATRHLGEDVATETSK